MKPLLSRIVLAVLALIAFAFASKSYVAAASGHRAFPYVYYGFSVRQNAFVQLTGQVNGTQYQIVDLETKAVLVSGVVDLGQLRVFTFTQGPLRNGRRFKLEASEPVSAVLQYSGDTRGGSFFYPVKASPSRVGRDFLLTIPILSSLNEFVVFAHEDATFEIRRVSDGALVTRQTLRAGQRWLTTGSPLSQGVPYSVSSTGDVAIQSNGANGNANVPSSNGRDMGKQFLFATYNEGGGGAAVFAYEDAVVTLTNIDTGQVVEPGASVRPGVPRFFGNLDRNRFVLRATGNVAVWAGDLQGGVTIDDMGDDITLNQGQGGRIFYLRSQTFPTHVFVGTDRTSIEIKFYDTNGNVVSTENYTKDKDEFITIRERQSFRLEADRPVLIQTMGGNHFAATDNWAKALLQPYPFDNEPPVTLITAGPLEGENVVPPTAFTWSGTDDNTPTNQLQYSWRLNEDDWSAWSGDTSTTLATLAEGEYTFQVRARDLDLNVDPTPASRMFLYRVPKVTGLTLTPDVVKGGHTSIGKLSLNAPAPAGVKVLLRSSDPAAEVPQSLDVPKGAASVEFDVTTRRVGQDTTARITATLNQSEVTADLKIEAYKLVSARVEPNRLKGSKTAVFTVTTDAPAPTGGLTLTLSSSDPAVAEVPNTVTVLEGQSSAAVDVTTRRQVADRTVRVSASLDASEVGADLTVEAYKVFGASVSPDRVKGGKPAELTVTLDAPAPTGGVEVTLESSDPAAARVPGQVTVIEGQTTAKADVTTFSVTTEKPILLSAKLGSSTAEARIVVEPYKMASVVLVPPTVKGGAQVSQLTATVDAPAPSGGLLIELRSSDESGATLPATVRIAEGESSAQVEVKTKLVDATKSVVLTATLGESSKTGTLIVQPPVLTALTLTPDRVRGGLENSTGEVKIDMVAPIGGVNVRLRSSAQEASVPSSVTIPEGRDSATFTVTTEEVFRTTPAVILAECAETARNATLTIVIQGEQPDLIVEQIEAPSDVFFGERLIVRALIKNAGAGATNASGWRDRVALVRGQERAAQVEVVNPEFLEPGQRYWATFSFVVPRGTVGTWEVLATADVDQRVEETDETNNSLSKPIQVLKPPLPDLAVSNVRGPGIAIAGEPLPGPVEWTVQNIGDSRTPPGQLPYVDAVYLRNETTNAVRLIGEVTRSQVVDPGGLYNQAAAGLVVPRDLAPGLYRIVVVSDPQQRVYEFGTRENNVGAASRTIDIDGSVADLEAALIGVPPGGRSGETVLVRFKVTNKGPDTARGPWTDAVYLSTKPTFDEAAVVVGLFGRSQDLERDDFYTLDAPIKLPECTEGRHYVFVRADVGSSVAQGGRTGNDLAGPEPILMNLRSPDLAVGEAQAPGSGAAGDPVRVSWRVTNTGRAATGGSGWVDRVWLSREPVLGLDAVAVGTFARSGGLDPGESYRRDEEVRIPPDAAGRYYLVIQTDAGRSVEECGALLNNQAATGPILVANAAANLVPTLLSAPSTLQVGGPISVEWRVTNVGSTATPSSAWWDVVYLSPDGTLARAVPVSSFQRLGRLAPGEAYTARAVGVVPNLPPGTYSILVRTDAYGQVFEGALEGDNVVSAQATVAIAKVNLRPTTVTAPAEASSGQAMRVTWTVVNDGSDATFQTSWTDRVVLSRDQVLDSNDRVVGAQVRNGALAAGEVYTADLEVDIPAGLSGTWYVSSVVDWSNGVPETDEFDNVGPFTRVQISLPPPVDLAVEGVSAPLTGEVGERADVSYTVRNQGQTEANGRWVDLVYLSQDETWDPEDVLVARYERSARVRPGEAYVQSVVDRLPSVVPGRYWVIARTNVGRTLRESDFTNNAGTSGRTTQIDVPLLPIGESRSFTQEPGIDRFFRTPAPSDLTLRLETRSEDVLSNTDARARADAAVSRSAFDVRSERLYDQENSATVPETRAATYFSLFGLEALAPAEVRVRAVDVPFSAESFEPRLIGNQGRVTLTVQGGRLRSATGAFLIGQGREIAARKLTVVNSAVARVQFDLVDVPLGEYALELRRPGEAVRAPAPVVVEPARPARMDVVVVGNTKPRLGTTLTAVATITNTGNVDAEVVHVQGLFFDDVKLGWDRPADSLPPRSLEPGANWLFDDPTARFEGQSTNAQFVVRDWEPGGTRVCQLNVTGFERGKVSAFVLANPQTEAQFESRLRAEALAWREGLLSLPDPPPVDLRDLLADPEAWWASWRAYYVENGYLDRVTPNPPMSGGGDSCPYGDRPDPACIQEANRRFVQCRIEQRPAEECRKQLWWDQMKCKDVCCKPEEQCRDEGRGWSRVRQGRDRGLSGEEWGGGGGSCGGSGAGGGGACIDPLVPVDPNQKSGPAGVFGPQFVGPVYRIPYEVQFENLPQAQGAVARIVVEDPLDPLIDERTLRLGTMRIADTVIEVPPNSSRFVGRKRLLSDPGLFVEVDARIDLRTRTVRWVFTAIDERTGDLPTEATRGLLQPEDGTGRGQGSVSLQVGKKKGGTGTIVENEATIAFDREAAIQTNRWSNTSDDVAPTSRVSPITGATGAQFLVRWTAEDDLGGSGVESFDVYVSVNGGRFVPWLERTAAGQAVYDGSQGFTYAFYSRARDLVGNLERAKTAAEASLDTSQFGPTGALAPGVRSLTPGSVQAGSPSIKVTVRGRNFQGDVIALWNGQERPVTWVSATEVVVDVSSTLLEQPGEASLVFVNPGPKGGRSRAVTFRILP